MGRETELFKSEQKMSIGDAAIFLRNVADKLEKRQIVLIQGDRIRKSNSISRTE